MHAVTPGALEYLETISAGGTVSGRADEVDFTEFSFDADFILLDSEGFCTSSTSKWPALHDVVYDDCDDHPRTLL